MNNSMYQFGSGVLVVLVMMVLLFAYQTAKAMTNRIPWSGIFTTLVAPTSAWLSIDTWHPFTMGVAVCAVIVLANCFAEIGVRLWEWVTGHASITATFNISCLAIGWVLGMVGKMAYSLAGYGDGTILPVWQAAAFLGASVVAGSTLVRVWLWLSEKVFHTQSTETSAQQEAA